MQSRDRTHEPRERDAYMTIDERVIPALLKHFIPRGVVWEPAAGTGEMVRGLRGEGCSVVATGLIDGPGSLLKVPRDFFSFNEPLGGSINSIITNPPNKLNLSFARHAIKLMEPAHGAVAIYQRHEWDTTKRAAEIFDHPAFAMKIVPRFRPIWVEPTPGKKAASPFHKWSWYVWDWTHSGPPVVRFA